MKICFFGIYRPDYSRNKILINGLRENGVEVVECNSRTTGIRKYFDLYKKHKKIKNSYDIMLVAYPGFQAMILAKLITNKPIIFDAFVSIYDSMVMDRKQFSVKSLRAKYFWLLDKLSMSLADVVLLDTNEHINYVVKQFNLDRKKFERVFVGADTKLFYPRTPKQGETIFKVLFYGTFIPLQGIDYIIEAAKILEEEQDIKIEIIGSGQEKQRVLEKAKSLEISNVDFFDSIPIQELPDRIAASDVCLGIFGNTNKAKRVIPNKVYECVAMQKAVITADTLAERELFDIGDFYFVEISNSQAIAEAILKLKNDAELRTRIAESGYNKLLATATPNILGNQVLQIANKLRKTK